MKICIARLRSGANYVTPLEHIMDSFYELLRRYVTQHTEHEYTFYNFGFGFKPIRNLDAIKEADVIVIPSEAEFTYWIPHNMHPLDLKKSNDHLDALKPYMEGKRVIILRSDRRDDEELYRTKVFPGVNIHYSIIDECDFDGNVHGMKYHFIKKNATLFDDESKALDFCYWGSDKRKTIDGTLSGDNRHVILKQIFKNKDLHTCFIGRFYGFKRDFKWMRMRELIPILKNTRSTICWNWMDNRATTSRYVEAIATGVYPFVWEDYDSSNSFVATDWQRVASYQEYLDKLNELQYDADGAHFNAVKEKLLEKIKTPEEYYTQFEGMMNALLL